MNQSSLEFLESLARKPADFNYDGEIVEIFENDVHVRVAGSNVIKKNVLLADHIDKEQLRLGLKVKLDDQHERTGGRQGKPYVVAIYPELDYGDYGGKGSVTPEPPTVSVSADCDSTEWSIEWTYVEGATYYELYWSSQPDGSGATLITETVFRKYEVPFDAEVPPKMYFAAKAISGINESELSPWVTDLAFLQHARMVVFGDNQNHGHVTPTNGTRWKVYDGQVLKSTDNGGSWTDVTPSAPDNDFSQTPAPSAGDISYIQVFGDDGEIYVLGNYDDGSISGAWLFITNDDGDTWTDEPFADGNTDAYAVWGSYNSVVVAITFWTEDGLLWGAFVKPDLDLPGVFYVGMLYESCSKTDVADKTAYAFPVCAIDITDQLFIAGRMNDPDGLTGVHNIVKYDLDPSPAIESIEAGWGTHVCTSLVIGPDDGAGNREIWYTREAP